MSLKRRLLSAVLCLVFALSLFSGAVEAPQEGGEKGNCICTEKCTEEKTNNECPVCAENPNACTCVNQQESEDGQESENEQDPENGQEPESEQKPETQQESEDQQEPEDGQELENEQDPEDKQEPENGQEPEDQQEPENEQEPVSISGWTWVGTDSLNEGVLPLTAISNVDEISPEVFAEIVALLPVGIQAEGLETVIPVSWKQEALTAADKENEYILTAVLPEGYVLAEGAAALSVTLLLGGDIADTLEPKTIEVNSYDSLLEALYEAEDGDTISLAAGTYNATENNQLRITVPNITIQGAGADSTVINTGACSVSGQAGILVEASGVTIKNLTVNSSAGAGVSAIKFTKMDAGTLDTGTIAMVTISSQGHALNIHGVNNMNVSGLNVSSAGKCGISIANSPSVTVSGSAFTGTNWADIGMMYSGSSAYANPSNLTLGPGNGFSNKTVVYSERPATAAGGADKIETAVDSNLVFVPAENGAWVAGAPSDSAKAMVRNLRTRLYYTEIEDALKYAQSDDTLILNDNLSVDKMLDISKDGVTLDLNGKTITASGNFTYTDTNNMIDAHVVNVSGSSVTIKNGSIVATAKNKHALNIYQASGVVLENMTLDHSNAGFKGAPLVVNAADVTVNGALNIILGQNSWYAANVDPKDGTAASLNFASGSSLAMTGGAEGRKIIFSENKGTVTGTENVGLQQTAEGVWNSVPKEVTITTAQELAEAIKNQAARQTWNIQPGIYNLDQDCLDMYSDWKNPGNSSQGGWYFPIHVDGLTINGNGATVTSSVASANGAWSTQDFISVWSDNVTINGLNIQSKSVVNKAVEVMGKNFSMSGCTILPVEEEGKKFSGSIIFNGNAINGGDIGNASISDVTTYGWISASNSYSSSGTLNTRNVTIDFVDNTYSGYNQDGNYAWKAGVIGKSVNVNNSGLTIKVDENINLNEQVFSDILLPNTTVELNGNVSLGSMLDIDKAGVTLNLNGHSISAAEDFDNTKGTHVVNVTGDNVTLKNGTIVAGENNDQCVNIENAQNTVLENLTLDHSKAGKESAALVVDDSDVDVVGKLELEVGENSTAGIKVNADTAAGIDLRKAAVTMEGNNELAVMRVVNGNKVTVEGAVDAGLTDKGDGNYTGGHIHSYGSNFKHDDSKHWKECKCGEKAEEAEHSFTKVIVAATDTAKGYSCDRCSVCGYEKNRVDLPISVRITYGEKAKWLYGSSVGLTFRSNGELAYFENLYIDGNYVDPQYYTVERGSTILKLSTSYLNSLKLGRHSLRMEFDTASSGYANAYADTVFYTYTLTSSPFTGDESNMMLWTAMMVMAAAGMGVAIILIKRRGARS